MCFAHRPHLDVIDHQDPDESALSPLLSSLLATCGDLLLNVTTDRKCSECGTQFAQTHKQILCLPRAVRAAVPRNDICNSLDETTRGALKDLLKAHPTIAQHMGLTTPVVHDPFAADDVEKVAGYCDKCQNDVEVEQFTHVDFPAVFSIMLKRETGGKPREKVTIPRAIGKAKLVAIIERLGISDIAGHYICYGVRANQWFRFDDETVEQRAPNLDSNTDVYLCFYDEQGSDTPPSGATTDALEATMANRNDGSFSRFSADNIDDVETTDTALDIGYSERGEVSKAATEKEHTVTVGDADKKRSARKSGHEPIAKRTRPET